MAEKVLLLVGTRKGIFLLESDAGRRDWRQRGPFNVNWPMNHVVGDPASGIIYGAGGNDWFGPAVWKTTDFGESWTHSSEGLAYAEGEEPVKAVWSLAQRNGTLYAGVEPAGLFRSDDGGTAWQHVSGLRDHPSRSEWHAGGGGLILHSLVVHPEDEGQVWIAISAAGIFHTDDAGKTWHPRNRGTRADFLPEDRRFPEYGQCVHALVMAAGMPDRLYQQNHCGMYRSEDGGQTWESIESGLPSTFGFPAAAHPRDADTIYFVPLNGDDAGRHMPDGKAAVWRSRDRGDSWQALRKGLPQENVYFGVYRQALSTDRLDPAGVYFGTSTGALYASADEGESWSRIAENLPAILSVETMVVEQ